MTQRNNQRFLITGLPRSRTAWFAVATGAAHEPTASLGWADLKRQWHTGDIIGVSDHGLAHKLPEILADIQPRTLIIERPRAEVMASMRAYLKPAPHILADWEAHGADVLFGIEYRLSQVSHPLIKRVAFKDLNDMTVMRSCMDHLGVKPQNLAQLQHMRIGSTLSHQLSLLRNLAAA